MKLSNRQWRILFGAINAGCAFLIIQPQVAAIPTLTIVLGTVVAVLGFLRAPDDTVPEAEVADQ